MSLQDDSTLISIGESPPLIPMPTSNHLIKRVPSLTQVHVTEGNLTPLLNERKQEIYYSYLEQFIIIYNKNETKCFHVILKLLLHILFISITNIFKIINIKKYFLNL